MYELGLESRSSETWLKIRTPHDVTTFQNCGSQRRPYTIKTNPGQKISVRILDFGIISRKRNTGRTTGLGTCHLLAKVVEIHGKNQRRNVTVCAGHAREITVLESEANEVEIVTNWNRLEEKNYLLEYKSKQTLLFLQNPIIQCEII